MKINVHHHRIILLIGFAIGIFWAGRLSIQHQIAQHIPAVQALPEQNQSVPTIDIVSIENAEIFGTVSDQQIRIHSGEQVAIPNKDHSFTLNIQHLGYLGPKRPVIDHHIPEWARFVASKKGKYFYEIDEKQAKRLSVPNRMYFANPDEAHAAGYQKR